MPRKGQPKGQPQAGKGKGAQAPREICNKFNLGWCTDPCPHGRKHVCAGCNAGGHGLHACPQAGQQEAER